jgi:hypothetical protein
MVSGSLSSPNRGSSHLSVALLGSLSVIREYLALRDGPRRFSRDFTWLDLLRYLSRDQLGYVYGTVTLCGPAFLRGSTTDWFCNSHVRGPTTPQRKPSRFGLFRFRSPLLTESIFLSFPPGTEMFQFSGLAARRLWIQRPLIQEFRDRCLFVSSPGLFADFHAFHRLLMPRHPPCALSSLTT